MSSRRSAAKALVPCYLMAVVLQLSPAHRFTGIQSKSARPSHCSAVPCRNVLQVTYHTDSSFVMQAAVSAAAAAVLRNHVVSLQDLEAVAAAFPEREAQQVVSDCVRALCHWRDNVARHEDEGTVCWSSPWPPSARCLTLSSLPPPNSGCSLMLSSFPHSSLLWSPCHSLLIHPASRLEFCLPLSLPPSPASCHCLLFLPPICLHVIPGSSNSVLPHVLLSV